MSITRKLLAGMILVAFCASAGAQLTPKDLKRVRDNVHTATAPEVLPARPEGLDVKDFAGTWTGQTKYQKMTVTLVIDKAGHVTGGKMGRHPFRKKGKLTITDATKLDGGFKITCYFSDVCSDKIKTIEKAKFTTGKRGGHRIEGEFRNPCFPASNGWIKLQRKVVQRPGKIDPETLEGAGQLLWTGKYARAIKAYQALAADPARALDAAIGLSRSQRAVGKYDQAIASLKAVTKAGKISAEWHIAMSEALAEVGKYKEALEAATIARALRRDWGPAIYCLGQALETVGRKARAIEAYRTLGRY